MDDQVQVPNVARLGPSRPALAGSVALGTAGIVAVVVALAFFSPALAPLAGFGMAAAALGTLGALVFGTRLNKPGKRATLTIDRDGLSLGDKRLAFRRDIKSGLVYQHAGTHRVRLSTRGPRQPIELAVEDVVEGRKVLEGLGLDAGHTLARFWVDGPSWAHWKKRWGLSALGPLLVAGSIVTSGVLGGTFWMPYLVALAVLMALAGFIQLFFPARVAIGADGILVKWLWQEKFIPLNEIESVEDADPGPTLTIYPKSLRIRLKSGGTEEILVGVGRGSLFGEYEYVAKPLQKKRDMVKGRIAEAMAAATTGKRTNETLVLPTRGPRPVHEWVQELRALMAQQDYRAKAPPLHEELWHLVEDASGDPAQRAAAAVSLGPLLDEQGRNRLRVAADAVAAPRLRVALQSVAAQDDALLDDALEEVVREGAAPVKSNSR